MAVAIPIIIAASPTTPTQTRHEHTHTHTHTNADRATLIPPPHPHPTHPRPASVTMMWVSSMQTTTNTHRPQHTRTNTHTCRRHYRCGRYRKHSVMMTIGIAVISSPPTFSHCRVGTPFLHQQRPQYHPAPRPRGHPLATIATFIKWVITAAVTTANISIVLS